MIQSSWDNRIEKAMFLNGNINFTGNNPGSTTTIMFLYRFPGCGSSVKRKKDAAQTGTAPRKGRSLLHGE